MSDRTKDIQKQDSETKKAVVLLVSLVLCSAAVLCVYRFMMNFENFEYVMYAYWAIEAVLVFSYVIYNRGFSRKNVTPEMLPESWSDEEKSDFIESGKIRLRKSRWMLVPIFAFLFTFAVDVFELFVFPMIFDMIGI